MADLKPQRYKDTRPAELFQPVHEWSRTHDAELGLRGGAADHHLDRALRLPHPRDLGAATCPRRARDPGAEPLFEHGPLLRRRLHPAARSGSWPSRSCSARTRSSTTSSEYGGVFPVRRGHHDEEAFITANAILERGGCVLMYAEGGRSRTGELGEAKPGVGRLALESGVPVVPVAIHGSQERARAGSGSASPRSRSSTASRSPSPRSSRTRPASSSSTRPSRSSTRSRRCTRRSRRAAA